MKIKNCLPAQAGKLKIVFIGTPEIGAIVLEKLIEGGYAPVLVVASPDKKVGRKQIITPPPVKKAAQKHDIPVLQPEKIKDITQKIQSVNPDLIVVAASSYIIPKEILDIPKHGSLNVHPSLLPRWRGPSPVQFTILNGDEKAGVTIMKISEKLDAGPIVFQKEIALEGKETNVQLHGKLGEAGGELLVEVIPKWIKGEIKPENQDEKAATYSKILKKEDGRIDWKKTAQDLERQIRAFSPWPGSFTFWQREKKQIKIEILKARAYENSAAEKYPTGKTLVAPQNHLCVQTGKEFLVVESLQMEGKKEMNSEDFIRGFSDFIGTILQ